MGYFTDVSCISMTNLEWLRTYPRVVPNRNEICSTISPLPTVIYWLGVIVQCAPCIWIAEISLKNMDNLSVGITAIADASLGCRSHSDSYFES